jgi:hypothetical protein
MEKVADAHDIHVIFHGSLIEGGEFSQTLCISMLKEGLVNKTNQEQS